MFLLIFIVVLVSPFPYPLSINIISVFSRPPSLPPFALPPLFFDCDPPVLHINPPTNVTVWCLILSWSPQEFNTALCCPVGSRRSAMQPLCNKLV